MEAGAAILRAGTTRVHPNLAICPRTAREDGSVSKKKKEHVTFDQMNVPRQRPNYSNARQTVKHQGGYQQVAGNQKRLMLTKRPTAR